MGMDMITQSRLVEWIIRYTYALRQSLAETSISEIRESYRLRAKSKVGWHIEVTISKCAISRYFQFYYEPTGNIR